MLNIRCGVVLGILGLLSAGLCGPPALGQTGAPTQGEIIDKLLRTSRGLPIAGSTANRPEAKSPITAAIAPPVPRSRSDGSVSPSAPPRSAITHASATSRAAEPGRIALDTIQFEFDSDQLKPESVQTLRSLGNALNSEKLKDQKLFLIEGHTDAVGTREYNMALSGRRAEAVKDYLVREMGVAPDRLQTAGRGFSEPAVPRDPRAAKNRRVEVVDLGG